MHGKGEQKSILLNREAAIAIFALLGIATHLILRLLSTLNPFILSLPLLIVLIAGGSWLVYGLLKKLINLEFGSDLLAGISIITSLLLGEYLAGAIVVLMLSGGEALETFAIGKASSALEALAKRIPQRANKKVGDKLELISVDQINIDDLIVVLPHEICPCDGEVLEGHGSMDEAYLTGEPFLISKTPGSAVISGAINGEHAFTIRATATAQNSRYAKIANTMRETQEARIPLRRLADQLGAWYTPLCLLIAALAWILSGEASRFLAVLVIATPCPLLIAIPVAIIGSISYAAKRSIIVRDPAVLEQIDRCQTMILDKTGTLTYGVPSLSHQVYFGDLEKTSILRLAAVIEQYSKHPLAQAILAEAKTRQINLGLASQITEPPGTGLRGLVEGHEVRITSRKQLAKQSSPFLSELPPTKGGLECIVLIDGKLSALFQFRDTPRQESKSFIKHLGPFHNFKHVMIVSGDRESEVQYLAELVGIKEIYASKSPEEKVAIVRSETLKAKTLYIGDGINDAPALLAATVGIAFGSGNDVTAQAAGVIIMEPSLARVDEFFHIAARMKQIALQSAVGGMLLSLVGMALASFGLIAPVAGAMLQEGIDLFAVLNALRVAYPIKVPTDLGKQTP